MDNKEQRQIKNQYDLEKELYDFCLSICREEYVKLMEYMDDWILKHRDKEFFALKATNERSQKTLFGNVKYRRRGYAYKTLNGESETVYLLDELFNNEKLGNFSLAMAEEIAMRLEETREGTALVKDMQDRHHLEITRQAMYWLMKKYRAYTDELAKESLNA